MSFTPEEDQVQYSTMTGQSLFYMGEHNLVHKTLAISEEEGADRASYSIKLMQSEHRLCIASAGRNPKTGKLETHEYRVNGPAQIMFTTTAEEVDEEMQNRCLVITSNATREQTKKIHERQRYAETLEGMLEIEDHERTFKLHRNAQRLLRPLKVVNPYAKELTFIDSKLRTRRDHKKYLNLIRAVTLLHQYQRPLKKVNHNGRVIEYIESTLDDIEIANRLAAHTLGTSLDELAHGEPPGRAFPDLVLSRAIASAGNVYLAYHHSVVDLERSEAFRELVDLLLKDETIAAARLASKIDRRLRQRIKNDEDYGLQRPLDRALIVAALVRDPTLGAPRLAEQVEIVDHEFLERAFERCRDTVLRWKVTEWLDAQPDRWRTDPGELVVELYGALTGREFIGENPLMHAVIRAYREVLSYAATTDRQLAPLSRVAQITRPVDGIAPVHFAQAHAARRCCFANFEPDLDGTVRRVALIERHGGNVLGQLAFSVGWDLLGIAADGVAVRSRQLALTPVDASRAPIVIQLDSRGRTVIPWARGREWARQFQHLPASAALQLYDHRRNLAYNRAQVAAVLQLVFSSEFLPDFHEFADLLAERPEVARQAEWERLQGDTELAAFFDEQIERIDEEAARGEQQLRSLVGREQEHLSPDGPPEGGLSARIMDDLLYYLGELDQLHDARRDLERDIEAMTERLAGIFRDRICVVGYAATSLADMKPIPTHRSAPGLMAHANLLNGLLTGQLVRWATLPRNIMIVLAFGIVTTFIATYLPPRLSLLLAAFMVVSFVAIGGALAFYRWNYWLALTPAVTTTVLCYVLIAVYRYVFVEGERRQLATALGQYTSKEMARQMAENPELCRKAEMREVTAVFTDLKGFTGISERIG
ncbi:MAG: CHASE2 domain-containing protein, partial [Planctomycetes bacterium]|nr:CHASE2 domain-containing protein [Planctomycetota bacterium]